MKYIKLFERKDYELSERIKNIYDDLLNQMNKGKNKLLFNDKNNFYYFDLYSNIISATIWIIFPLYDKENPSFQIGRNTERELIPIISFPNIGLTQPYEDKTYIDTSVYNKIMQTVLNEKSIYYHEIQHFYDYIIYGRRLTTGTGTILKLKGDNEYYNTDKELNAYFIQAVSDFTEGDDFGINHTSLRHFDYFKYDFINKEFFKEFYKNLTEKNKKRIDKRIYQVYLDIRNKYSYKEKNANLSKVGQIQKVFLPNKMEVEGIVIKKPFYKLIPLDNNNILMDHEYKIYNNIGDVNDKFVYDLKTPEQLPPIIIDKNNNVIFDYFNVYNIAKLNNLKIINCIIK